MVTVETRPLLLTVKATAALIGISERRVWHLIERGQLPSHKIGGRRYVPVQDAEAFVERLRHERDAA